MKPIQHSSSGEFSALPDDALIRLGTLIAWALIPFSVATLWRKVRSGDFPAPLKVSTQVTAWRVGDIRRWLASPAAFQTSNKWDDTKRGRA